jgi:hypothetical protein
MQKVSQWKTLPLQQCSEDAIWELTRHWNCYLISDQSHTFSRDPLNLTGLNTRRDSGLASTHALGVGHETVQRNFKDKTGKKKGKVVRFTLRIKTKRQIPKRRLVALKADQLPLHNNTVFSDRRRVGFRAVVKALQRDLTTYRRDLVPIALRRVRRLNRFKLANKQNNRPKKQK